MRKKIALIGVAVLVIGAVLFVVGLAELNANVATGTTMKQTATGEWTSTEFNLTSGNVLTVITNNTSFAVVSASHLSSVNATNYGHYSLNNNGQINRSVGYVSSYTDDNGHYYLVIFSQHQPSVAYAVDTSQSAAVTYGLFEAVGVILIIAGVIVAAVGALLKNRKKAEQGT